MSEAFGALAGASGKLPRGNDLLANVRFGSWPFQNVLPLEVGTRRSGGVS